MFMTTTPNNQISKAAKVRAGLYRGTLTVEGRIFPYEVERGEVGVNCGAGDGGWWRIGVDRDSSGYDYGSKAEAIASLHAAEWYIDTDWGLCQR